MENSRDHQAEESGEGVGPPDVGEKKIETPEPATEDAVAFSMEFEDVGEEEGIFSGEGEEEEQHGSSDRHKQISSALTEMAKVARSFLLYDPRNKAIHQFLTSLLDNIVDCLSEGPIKLMVQPFELWYEGEVVYLNRDREKSLAFRFYRDGVRGLHFVPGFHWEELAKLLEILSIRYTGVHQHEDDVVTLLWKANFQHLEMVAVEGFVPEDDEEEEDVQEMSLRFSKAAGESGGGALGGGGGGGTSLPDNVDLPPPHLPDKQIPVWEEVPQYILSRYQAEVGLQALPRDCLKLLRHLRRQLNSSQNKWRFEEFSHVFTEIREFLLVEEHLVPSQAYLDFVEEMYKEEPPLWDPSRKAALLEIRKSFGDERAVRKLLHSIPVEERKLNPEFRKVLERVCRDPFAQVLNALAHEHANSTRAVGRQILEQLGADRIDDLEARFSAVTGHQAVDLLRVVANIGGEKAATFVAQQCSHTDTEVQDEALRHLKKMPYSGIVGKAIFSAFRKADSGRRSKLLEIIQHTGDRRFVDNLSRMLEEHGGQITPEDAQEIGRVLGQMGGERYLERWQTWLAPKGWLKKTLSGSLAQQIAAAVALSEISLEEAEKTLRSALKVATPAAQPWIGRALSHQRSLSGRTSS